MARKNSRCENCDSFETLNYDVGAGGYVCEKCGMVWDCEQVELGDYDVAPDEFCPNCNSLMKTVVGETSDLSYGEYMECPNCGYKTICQ